MDPGQIRLPITSTGLDVIFNFQPQAPTPVQTSAVQISHFFVQVGRYGFGFEPTKLEVPQPLTICWRDFYSLLGPWAPLTRYHTLQGGIFFGRNL